MNRPLCRWRRYPRASRSPRFRSHSSPTRVSEEALQPTAESCLLPLTLAAEPWLLPDAKRGFFARRVAVFGTTGRYGAYGAPTDLKVLSDTGAESGSARKLEVAFTALSPSSAEVPRRCIVAATQPAGSSELVLLTAGTGAARWKKGGKEESTVAVESFAVKTRPTTLEQVPSSDYRYGKTSGPSNMNSRNDGF